MIQRLEPKLAKVDGISVFLQPLQDLTVEDRVSRTQYQYSLEDANRKSWRFGRQDCREAEDDSGFERCGERPAVGRAEGDAGDRPRYGVAAGDYAADIDDTLDDAFGQRQVSTIFTQQNQYHVVLEVAPKFQRNPIVARQIFM